MSDIGGLYVCANVLDMYCLNTEHREISLFEKGTLMLHVHSQDIQETEFFYISEEIFLYDNCLFSLFVTRPRQCLVEFETQLVAELEKRGLKKIL